MFIDLPNIFGVPRKDGPWLDVASPVLQTSVNGYLGVPADAPDYHLHAVQACHRACHLVMASTAPDDVARHRLVSDIVLACAWLQALRPALIRVRRRARLRHPYQWHTLQTHSAHEMGVAYAFHLYILISFHRLRKPRKASDCLVGFPDTLLGLPVTREDSRVLDPTKLLFDMACEAALFDDSQRDRRLSRKRCFDFQEILGCRNIAEIAIHLDPNRPGVEFVQGVGPGSAGSAKQRSAQAIVSAADSSEAEPAPDKAHPLTAVEEDILKAIAHHGAMPGKTLAGKIGRCIGYTRTLAGRLVAKGRLVNTSQGGGYSIPI